MKNNKLTDFGFLWLFDFFGFLLLVRPAVGPFENIVFQFLNSSAERNCHQ